METLSPNDSSVYSIIFIYHPGATDTPCLGSGIGEIFPNEFGILILYALVYQHSMAIFQVTSFLIMLYNLTVTYLASTELVC